MKTRPSLDFRVGRDSLGSTSWTGTCPTSPGETGGDDPGTRVGSNRQIPILPRSGPSQTLPSLFSLDPTLHPLLAPSLRPLPTRGR